MDSSADSNSINKTPCNSLPLLLAGGSDGSLANLTVSVFEAGIDVIRDAEDATILAAPDAQGDEILLNYLAAEAEASIYKFAILDPALTEAEGDTCV